MANSESIKKYLIEGNKSYLDNNDNNGTILMLSGAWGSGKTHFWKNIIETDLIPKIKARNKSYIFVSLYGKDSIKDIENEILQKAYSFLYDSNNDLIKKASSVFTKSVDFIPKISLFGFEIDPKNIAKLKDELSNKEKLHKASEALSNGIVCFDDFERKSSKIDLNDLFGFITNLTENFNTKTVIITNQEVFQHHDQEVFNTVKEKSVNKFILYNPTIEELFDIIYKNDKYKLLVQYKVKILEAIQLSEEKNARIYIQVLNNCLEYAEKVKGVDERAIYLLTLVTVIFVKHNLIFRIQIYHYSFGYSSYEYFLPNIIDKLSKNIFSSLISTHINNKNTVLNQESFIDFLNKEVSNLYKVKDSVARVPTNLLDYDLKNISENKDTLFIIYKYFLVHQSYLVQDTSLLEKVNNFVESGILLEE